MLIEVRLENYPYIWATGRELVSARVSLGSNERSSSTLVTLADPQGKIAADLIDHSLRSGGIVAIPAPKGDRSVAPGTSSVIPSSSGVALEVTTPARKAFLDMIAFAEGTYGPARTNGYGTIVGYGEFTDFSRHPEPPIGSAGSDASGRYQFLSTTWAALDLPDFSPANQDRGALKLVEGRGALSALDSGNIEQAITLCNQEWASFPGSPYGQPTKSMSEMLRFYQERLSYYSGTPDPGNTSGVAVTTSAPKATLATPDLFKGKKLTVTAYPSGSQGYSFIFYHQSTQTNQDGLTTLTGQGIRWAISRRPRNASRSDLSFKDLAETIAKSQGLELSYEADIDPLYSHIDQTGISDYQLLLREAGQLGLIVDEEGPKLRVRSLRNIRDTQLVFSPGRNLMSWEVKDAAIDASTAEDIGSSLRQSEPKVTLDPLSGQMTAQAVDVDPATASGTTGKPSGKPTGTLKPGQEAVAAASRSRYKRVKGLPTTLTAPLSQETLELRPLDAVRTLGLPGVLSRVFMVDSITHDLGEGISSLSCFSPVEVLDLTPTVPSGAGVAGSNQSNPGGFIFPTIPQAIFTSPYGPRVHPVTGQSRFHSGCDLAAAEGSPIYAMQQGTVSEAGTIGGYGLTVVLKHPNGYESLYAHNSQLMVRVGQSVTQGQTIALMGSTGLSTGSHAHVEIHDPSGNTLDPATLIKPFPALDSSLA